MLICPDCGTPLEGTLPEVECRTCSWTARIEDGIPDLVSSRDRASALFGTYRENYDRIARDDLEESIQDPTDLDLQTERLFPRLGEVRGLSVCDIGIGQGRLLARLADEGANVTGVDIAAPYLTRFQRNGVRLLVANAENLPFADEFDMIIAADVLEHVLNVGETLLSIHRALRRDGRLVIRVPYKDDLTAYTRAKGMEYETVHVRDFNRENLKRLLSNTGFAIETVAYDSFYPVKKRRYLDRFERVGNAFDRLMVRRVGSIWRDARLWPPLARSLIRPNVIMMLARKS